MLALVLMLAQASAPAVPPAAVAGSAATRRSYTSAEKATGIQIAELLNPRDVTRDLVLKGSVQPFRAALAVDPTYVELEKKYPGISAAIVEKLTAELARIVDERIGVIWERMGVVYAETFDQSQLDRLLGFYKGPTGQKLIRVMIGNVDMQKMIAKGMKNPEADMTAQDIRGAYKPGATAALSEAMTPKERLEVAELMMSPLGTKLIQINPRIAATVADWTNEMKAQDGDRAAEVVVDAGRQFIERSQGIDHTPGPKT